MKAEHTMVQNGQKQLAVICDEERQMVELEFGPDWAAHKASS